MDHPPSTPSSSRPARRALLTTAAALSALAAPIALVAVTLGGSSEPLAAKPVVSRVSQADAEVRTQGASAAVPFVDGASAIGADVPTTDVTGSLRGLQGLVAPTTVPPAPTTTAPPAPAAPAPAPAPAKGADPNDPATWDRLAQCEAGGNWGANTGNGYYGGLQFSPSTWRSVGGTGLPHEHSRETQIEMGKRLQARAGWSQWPSCTRRLGYR